MARNSSPQEFGPLLRKLFREHRREPALTLHQLREHWTAIAGEEMGSRTRPAKLERGTLWVDTPDACWAYELQFFKQDLLNSIEAFIKDSTVTGLRFSVARETPASPKEGDGLPAHPPSQPFPVEPVLGETIGLETPGLETPGLETPGVETPGVETPGVETMPSASPAGAGNPSSSQDVEPRPAGSRPTGPQDAGAGQKAGFGGDGWEGGGQREGGGTTVREAFQRMRDRRTRS